MSCQTRGSEEGVAPPPSLALPLALDLPPPPLHPWQVQSPDLLRRKRGLAHQGLQRQGLGRQPRLTLTLTLVQAGPGARGPPHPARADSISN